MSEIFISYSRKDEKWRKHIVSHLEAMSMNVWYDIQMTPGREWYPEIENKLDTADAFILLISRNFLTSKFIKDEEIPRILDRKETDGVIVVPVFAEPCGWKKVPWLSKMALRPKTGEPLSIGNEHQTDEELTVIAEELYDLLQIPLYAQLKELNRLLSTSISTLPADNELMEICRQCLPSHIPSPKWTTFNEKNMLACILDWLAHKSQLSSGETPLLDFVSRLIPFVSKPEISGKLREWIRRTAKNLGLTPDEINALGKNRPSGSPKTSEPLYLLIKLEQKNPNKSEYTVQAWLFEGESGREVYTEESPFTLDRLPEHVGNILKCIDDHICSASEKLTIEFFLPDHLLNHNVEDLRIKGDDYPIGTDYRVVIRSLNRLLNSRCKNRWSQYWNQCDDVLGKDPSSCKFPVDMAEQCFPRSRLEKGIIFFILNLLPEQRFLIKLIQAGVPIVLWHRQKHNEEESCTCCQTLRQLPESIREKRVETWEYSGEKHTGHISLLWDDPKRVPLFEMKKKKLGAPDQ